MSHRAKLIVAASGILVLLPIVLALALIGFANTAPGRHFVEGLAGELSGGQVALHGLAGRFPDALTLERLELKDADGIWAEAENVSINWSPAYLLTGRARIDRLAAARIALLRQPKSPSSSQSKSFALPLRVDLTALAIARLELAAPIAGRAAALSVQGAARIDSLTQAHVDVTAERLDGAGSYRIAATLANGQAAAQLDAREPAQGLLAELAGLPDLGPLAITASLDGPRSAEAASVSITAGPLAAHAQGTIDLVGETADLTITASSPAMNPAPAISWQSMALNAQVAGPFTAPRAAGQLDIENLKAGDAALASLTASLSGSNGAVDLSASLAGLHLPGPAGDLFQATPVEVSATAHLDTPTRPFSFTLTHKLLKAGGQGTAGATQNAAITLDMPNLAPIAAAFGVDLQGSAALTANLSELSAADTATKLALGGTMTVTGGSAPLPGLLGDAVKLDLAATMNGRDLQLDHVELTGKAVQVSAQGGLTGDKLALGWQLMVSDLTKLAPTLAGSMSAEGQLSGPLNDLGLKANAKSALTVRGFPAGTVELAVTAQGLPDALAATLSAAGNLAGAPLQIAASLQQRRDGGFDLAIPALRWKSLAAKGEVALAPAATLPQGKIELHVTRLADLAPLLGVAIGGAVDGAVEMTAPQGRPQARLTLTGKQLTLEENAIDTVQLAGTIDDPIAHPKLALRVAATGIAAQGITGAATLTASGAIEAPALKLAGDLHASGTAAHLEAAANFDVSRQVLALNSLALQSQGTSLRLLGPTRVDFGKGVAIDRLRLGSAQAELDIAGEITPHLAVTASLRNLTQDAVKSLLPNFDARFTLSAAAKLGGTLASPTGSIRIIGSNLQYQGTSASGIAPAALDARGELSNGAMQVDLRLASRSNVALNVTGLVPLSAAGAVELRAKGRLDLAILDPVLTAGGRRVQGELTLDAAMEGSLAAPRLTGTAQLAKGEVQDFTQGLRLAGVTAELAADGGTVRLINLRATAGPGTITASGTFAPLADGMPVSLSITARNARPLASDLLTADLDADLSLRGKTAERLDLAGRIRIHRASINVPDSFPPSVAVLIVQKPGATPPPPLPNVTIGLDVTVEAPEQVFVRGHGLDAEMGGQMQVGGDIAAPQISGGFDLRRGTFSLASETLNFTSGKVSFEGAGLTRRLDPTLNFVAESSSASVTATLTVTGYADAPKIAITSVPELPQDEALAQLLFGQSVKQLSPFQLAEIAQAVAALTGVGGGLDPLGALRKSLGLDRLSAGSSSSGSGASLQAGKYIANGVYVGAQQGTTGGTRAQVQIDLTKHLKLDTGIGSGGAAPATGITPDNDPGSSVGLTYQLEY